VVIGVTDDGEIRARALDTGTADDIHAGWRPVQQRRALRQVRHSNAATQWVRPSARRARCRLQPDTVRAPNDRWPPLTSGTPDEHHAGFRAYPRERYTGISEFDPSKRDVLNNRLEAGGEVMFGTHPKTGVD
jgi:hypothetical protein